MRAGLSLGSFSRLCRQFWVGEPLKMSTEKGIVVLVTFLFFVCAYMCVFKAVLTDFCDTPGSF